MVPIQVWGNNFLNCGRILDLDTPKCLLDSKDKRQDRQDRPQRQDRQDRQHRQDRQDRQYRQDRQTQSGYVSSLHTILVLHVLLGIAKMGGGFLSKLVLNFIFDGGCDDYENENLRVTSRIFMFSM